MVMAWLDHLALLRCRSTMIVVAGLLGLFVAPVAGQSRFDGPDDVTWLTSKSRVTDDDGLEQTPPDPPVPPVPSDISPIVEPNDVALPVSEHVSEDVVWQAGCQDCGPTCGAGAGGHRCFAPGGLCGAQCRHTRVYRTCYLGRLWFDYEMLGWATKSQYAPPLLTTSTDPTDQGILERATTSILAGDETLHDQLQIGGRLTGGWWFHPDKSSGVEIHYFVLDGEDLFHQTESTFSEALLSRPFTNADTGIQDRELANPNTFSADVRVEVDMEFSGAGALYRTVLQSGCHHRIDIVGGYRYLRLHEHLHVNEDIVRETGLFRSGNRFDRFRSESEFHGGELGLVGRWQKGYWSLELVGKGAIGSSRRNILINGASTLVDVDGNVTAYEAGVLAQPSNIGNYNDDEFAFTSELGVSLQYDLTCQLRASVGYTFLYWSDVSRALDHVSLTIDPDLIPPPGGTAANTFEWVTDDFWAQGLTAGFEYQF